MIYCERECLNPITGKAVWGVRAIDGQYGDPWRCTITVTRKHWFSKTALLSRWMGKTTRQDMREFFRILLNLGFTHYYGLHKGDIIRKPI